MYETINSPLNYGGLTLKNRILFAPTSLGLSREELLERISSGAKGPLFTSCCPGWVSFAKSQYPELLPQLSTAKSPQLLRGKGKRM